MIAARGPLCSGWLSSQESDEENVASEPDSSSSKAAHRTSPVPGYDPGTLPVFSHAAGEVGAECPGALRRD